MAKATTGNENPVLLVSRFHTFSSNSNCWQRYGGLHGCPSRKVHTFFTDFPIPWGPWWQARFHGISVQKHLVAGQLCISVFEGLRCIQQRKVTTNTRIVQRSMRQVTGDTSSCISKLQSSKKSTWFGDVLWCGAWMVHSDPTILTTRMRWVSDNPTRSLNITHHLRSKSSCPVPKFNLCYTPPWQRGTPLHQRLRLGKAPWQMWHDWIMGPHDGIHASGWVF